MDDNTQQTPPPVSLQQPARSLLVQPEDSSDIELADFIKENERLQNNYWLSSDNVISLNFREEENEETLTKILKIVCANMKQSQAVKVDLYSDWVFSSAQNKLLIAAFNVLVRVGFLKDITLTMAGYEKEDLPLLAELYEKIILAGDISNPHSPRLEHIDIDLSTFPITDPPFIRRFRDENLRSLDASINRLPESITFRAHELEHDSTIQEVVKYHKSLKKLKVNDEFWPLKHEETERKAFSTGPSSNQGGLFWSSVPVTTAAVANVENNRSAGQGESPEKTKETHGENSDKNEGKDMQASLSKQVKKSF